MILPTSERARARRQNVALILTGIGFVVGIALLIPMQGAWT